MCVVAIVKYIMRMDNSAMDEAYAKFMEMDLYKLLMDSDTRLFMETNEYLCECCKKEREEGREAFYHFINAEGL